MKLTKKLAKQISIEVWEYLRDHPCLTDKFQLPDNIYKKIVHMKCECPLCELFDMSCHKCPLNCLDVKSWYNKWSFATTNRQRKKYASMIVDQIKSWQV